MVAIERKVMTFSKRTAKMRENFSRKRRASRINFDATRVYSNKKLPRLQRGNKTIIKEKASNATCASRLSNWCGRPDLNRYGCPHAPQTCASAYSATTALKITILLYNLIEILSISNSVFIKFIDTD